MWKEDLFKKKAWLDSATEKVNHQLDDLYSTIPESGLSDREKYLYDMSQNQFKMLYELLDLSKDLINTDLRFMQDTEKNRKNAGAQM